MPDRSPNLTRRAALALVALGVLCLSCRREEGGLGSPNAPLVVLLSESHGADPARVKELERVLSQASDLKVEVRVAPNSEEAVRMAGTPGVDAALLSTFEYLFCRQLYGVEAALVAVRLGGATSHQGDIVALANGPLQKLSELEGRKVAYVDRYSSTGYLLAQKLLFDANVHVTPVFTGSHEAALQALREGKADAAATYADSVEGQSDLRVLATTPALPNEPVFFRSGLLPEKRQKLTKAFEQLSASPEGKHALAGIAHIEGFKATSDRDYAGASALISSVGKSVKDVVPRGWIVSNEAERKPSDLAP